MTPIERVSIKSQALAVLGLKNSTATDLEIKSAYRARVKEKHPDRCNGASDEFMRITNAFEYLSGETQDFEPEFGVRQATVSRTPRPSMEFEQKPRTRSKTMSRPVSKPSLQATQIKFSQDILTACKALLRDDGGLVATHQRRVGRSVAYKVPVKLLRNVNKVALPTGDLVDTRRVQPVVLEINASEICDRAYRVPSDVVAQQFPGARTVEILFVADI
ncbi:MAG: DnaJ domain-containing protein [Silicimonas sp.]|nr:DnaJ domain-containing protein [Silicimonas sp.]